jgi:ATP-dependent exoDNAse (exonuclease V) beta subunit
MSDQIIRDRAIKPYSFHVQAPAGSGKTETLTQRFLNLLNYVENPEEILAITFTRKAAEEMRGRIVKALQKAQTAAAPQESHALATYQLACAVLKRDKEHAWNLLENTHRLRLMTFDSFCMNLATTLPVTSHLGVNVQIAEPPQPLYEKAVVELLRELEDNKSPHQQAIKNFLIHVDNDVSTAKALLIAMLEKREHWLSLMIDVSKHKEGSKNMLRDMLERVLNRIVTQKLKEASVFLKPLESELLACAYFAGSQLQESDSESPVVQLLSTGQLPSTNGGGLTLWKAISYFLLTDKGKGTLRKTITVKEGFPARTTVKDKEQQALNESFKDRMKTLLDSLRYIPNAESTLQAITTLPSPNYSEGQWQIIEDLSTILPTLAATLTTVFSEAGQVDFSEVTQRALQALGDDELPTDLALKLDYKIKHILVDEFQDTNKTQIDLLTRLTEGWSTDDGHTLFVVGDPMQSIYSFRKANVSCFLTTRKKGIGAVELEPLTLTRNFRSQKAIVDWNNEQFEQSFPKDIDIALGAVKYEKSEATKATQAHKAIHLHAFVGADKSKARNAEAAHIAQFIQDVRSENPSEEIAILVRSRNHLLHILPALRAAQLEWQAIDIELLSEQPVINDLLLITRALLNVSDRIAWLGLLRAPFVGLNKKSLLTLAGTHEYCAVWDQLHDETRLNQLSDELRKRLEHFTKVMEQGLLRMQRKPLSVVVEGVWLMLGGPACLSTHADMDNANTFLQVVSDLDQQHELITVEMLQEATDKLYAKNNVTTDNPIKIMTIYSAKGLEFGTVILPCLDKGTQRDKNELLMFEEWQSDGFLFAASPSQGDEDALLYEFIKQYGLQKKQLELTRVMYVACTRAENRLYLSGVLSKSDSTPSKDCLWACMWDSISAEVEQHVCGEVNDNVDANDEVESDEDVLDINHDKLMRLPLNWQLPELAEEQLLAKYRQPVYLPDSDNRLKIDNTFERRVGEVIHAILKQIGDEGLGQWNDERIRREQAHWQKQIKRMGIAQADNALKMVNKHIESVLNDAPNRDWLFGNYAEHHNEYALQTLKEGEVLTSIVDRTFVDGEGTRWIVDYKTSTPNDGEALEVFLTREAEQYADQLKRYHDLFKARGDSSIKTALYFTGLGCLYKVEV